MQRHIFAEELAKLHQVSGTKNYGLDFDTWLGPEYQQINGWKLGEVFCRTAYWMAITTLQRIKV